MPDLSPLDAQLSTFKKQIDGLRRGGSAESQKPHKLFMLLAVIDLFDQEHLHDNQIYLDQQLQNNFEKYFRLYAGPDDWCQPGPPFFHLISATFWKHKIKPGRESDYQKLKTSGGGTKKIYEYVEFAYLDEQTFSLFSQEALRAEIKAYILALLKGLDMERIPTVFHEKIPFSRPSITQILNALGKTHTDVNFGSKEEREIFFREHTQLGTNYVKAMPEYAKGAGLLNFKHELTLFGKFAKKNDASLGLLNTQWLMHYHLSAPQGPGPAFWHEIVYNRFRSGNVFTQKDIENDVSLIYLRDQGKALSPISATSTANIFLGTYVRSDGLANLGLLEEISNDHYRIAEVDAPPVWTIAAAVLAYWKTAFPNQVGINLSSLTTESKLPSLFMTSRSKLDLVLGEMRDAGLVELFRSAPPYQVALLDDNPEIIFQRMYAYE